MIYLDSVGCFEIIADSWSAHSKPAEELTKSIEHFHQFGR
jgi:hypothetical protein